MLSRFDPLWMPAGSVRSILALGLVGGVVAGFFLGMIQGDAVVQLASVAVAFYFAGRNGNGNGS